MAELTGSHECFGYGIQGYIEGMQPLLSGNWLISEEHHKLPGQSQPIGPLPSPPRELPP